MIVGSRFVQNPEYNFSLQIQHVICKHNSNQIILVGKNNFSMLIPIFSQLGDFILLITRSVQPKIWSLHS